MSVICFLSVFLFANPAVFAQKESPLFERIENSIKENQPQLKLERRRIANGGTSARYTWRSNSSSVYVFVFILSSSETAVQEFKALPNVLEADGIRMSIVHAIIPGLGDQNYLWEGVEKERRFGVDFRQGDVVVHVDASSIAMAEQFAFQVAAAIPKSVAMR